MKIQYLVTGMPRSGTVYMARLLSSVGLMCGHESIFALGGIEGAIKALSDKYVKTSVVSNDVPESWFNHRTQVAESSYLAAPFLDHSCLADTKIIHVVRNPLLVISSLLLDVDFFKEKGQIPYLDFVYKHLPELKKINNEIERITAYYVWWNNIIEQKSLGKQYLRLKVGESVGSPLFDFLEIKQPKNLFTNTKINSWKKRASDLCLNDIPNGKIKNEFILLLEKYNYK